MTKSEIQGNEGKIKTYSFYPFNYELHISVSAVKWIKEGRDKPAPIWYERVDGYPSLFIGKVAIFYNGKVNKKG